MVALPPEPKPPRWRPSEPDQPEREREVEVHIIFVPRPRAWHPAIACFVVALILFGMLFVSGVGR